MDTKLKIDGFLGLPQGWHYGEGRIPTEDNIARAKSLVDSLIEEGFSHTDAFPGTEGEILVSAYHLDTYLEFTIEIDGTVTFVYEVEDKTQIYEECLTFQEAIARAKFWGLKWISSGLFTTSTMTLIKNVLLVSPLGPIDITKSRLLKANALLDRAGLFVSTQEDIIRIMPKLPQSSGQSTMKSSHHHAHSTSMSRKVMYATTT